MSWSVLRNPGLIVTVLVLLASAVSLGRVIDVFDLHLEKLPIHPPGNRQVAAVPRETPSWRQIGRDDVMSAEVLETLGTSNYLSRVYIEREPEDPSRTHAVDLHLAYYTGKIDAVPHIPDRCFVGGGMQKLGSREILALPMDTTDWSIDATVPEEAARAVSPQTGVVWRTLHPLTLTSVRLPGDIGPDRPIRASVTAFEREDGSRLHAAYFFIANGGVAARPEGVRALSFDLTNDYAYYLKVQITSLTARSGEELMEIGGSLIGELIAEIMRCVPDWVEVETGRYPADEPEGGPGGLG